MAKKRNADNLNLRIAQRQSTSEADHISRIRTAYSRRFSSTDMVKSVQKLDASPDIKNGENSNENATVPDLNNRRKYHQNCIPKEEDILKNKSTQNSVGRIAEKERKSPISPKPDTTRSVQKKNKNTEVQKTSDLMPFYTCYM